MNKTKRLQSWRPALRCIAGLSLAAPITFAATAQAQTFESGSSGADGAFDLTGRTGTVNFIPKDFKVNGVAGGPQIDADGDLVFHFTSITIPSGVTLKMSAEWTNGPIYWLATQDVTILGNSIIDLSGGTGHVRSASANERMPPLPGSDRFPGPGGFLGGLGGNTVLGPAQPGAGPGGGAAITGPHSSGYWVAYGATLAGNAFLVPLIGGSGGGGGVDQTTQWWASGGGAGGGALMIASRGTINLAGRIASRGGAGGYTGSNGCQHYSGGGGGGGSIRLVATTLTGGGTLDTDGQGSNAATCDSFSWSHGSDGRVRVEAYQYTANYTFNYTNSTRGTPFSTYVPAVLQRPPSIWIAEVDGQQVPPEPTGGFGSVGGVNQYVTIDAAPEEPVVVKINGRNLPSPGAKTLIPTLHVFALEGRDISRPCDAALAVDGDNPDLLTCQVTLPGTPTGSGFPVGFSRAYARVKWE